ncbi:hypothetical protein ABIE09_003311 [Lysobacter enzymogenes]|uniref:hypothetical protein n=1 Tax=Lysobacter enzymogenes TaxID=69 RepID=UPI003399FAF2
MAAMAWMLAAVGAVTVGADGGPPPGWVAMDPPMSDAGQYCANRSLEDWSVNTAADGTLVLRPERRRRRDPAVREVLADGALLGYNRGEFGGWIEWLPRDGGARFQVEYVNPVASTRYRGEVLVAEGLAHLGTNQGAVLRFERRDARRWRIHRLAELDAAPIAALRSGEKDWLLLVVDGLVKVDLDSGRVQRLYRSRDWWPVMPYSTQPLGQGWLLGAARGVVHLQPTADGAYRQRWWVPARCAQLQPSCTCADPPP